jgi:hypothetical protein
METTEAEVVPGSGSGGSTENLGFGGKFWNLFVDPRKTFAAVKPNHEWVIIWLIVAAVSIGAYMPIKDIVKHDQMARVEERLAQMSPEQRQEVLSGMEAQFENPIYLLFVPISQLVVMVIVAGVLLFIGNILLGGTAGYLRMLNAYAWTMLIVIPASIVTVPMVMAKGTMDVSLGLGVLTSADTGAFVKKILSSFELFGLWQVWLSAVAVSVIAEAPIRKALWSVLAAWFVWVLVQGGLATLGMNFGM